MAVARITKIILLPIQCARRLAEMKIPISIVRYSRMPMAGIYAHIVIFYRGDKIAVQPVLGNANFITRLTERYYTTLEVVDRHSF